MAQLERDPEWDAIEAALAGAPTCCELGCASDPGCGCEPCLLKRRSIWQRIKDAFGWTW